MANRDYREEALKLHAELKGKISVTPKQALSRDNLGLLYTPGVGAVSSFLAQEKDKTRDYTMTGNMVAVVSDGSAVLGLGNIGPEGALPVMEGKAMLFKALAGVDAFPLVLSTQDPDEIVAAVKAVAPSFGGINLEDIAAPKCYEIEARLQRELAIPVMHDDQHATAIVSLAGLINAAKVVGKDVKTMRIVVVGAGAAGSAIVKLLHEYGATHVTVTDSKGIIGPGRTDLDKYKQELRELTNPDQHDGDVLTAATGADAIIAVSGPGSVTPDHIRAMAADPIVFALANPQPEIDPDEAIAAGAKVIATGRSDYPNQINNVLVFPGLFRGALDRGVRDITPTIKIRSAEALAAIVEQPTAERIVPDIFDAKVVPAIAGAIRAL